MQREQDTNLVSNNDMAIFHTNRISSRNKMNINQSISQIPSSRLYQNSGFDSNRGSQTTKSTGIYQNEMFITPEKINRQMSNIFTKGAEFPTIKSAIRNSASEMSHYGSAKVKEDVHKANSLFSINLKGIATGTKSDTSLSEGLNR